MDFITIAFFVIAVAIVVYQFQSNGSTAVVPEEHRVETPPGGLTAIEYFWRPG